MSVNIQAWKVGFKWTRGDASNPAGSIAVDTTSKALHIADIADIETDWNVSADSHPSLYIHSATTPATDYIKIYHDATNGFFTIAGGILLFSGGAVDFGVDDDGIDVGFYGATASNSMLWDASSDALVFTAGGITMGTTSKMVLPVKASGSTTEGDIWVDTTDNKIHYYMASTEYTVTST